MAGQRCGRCHRIYRTTEAFSQHLADSSQHHICEACSFDGESDEALLEHYRSTKHRIICEGCDEDDNIWIPNSQEYLDHVATANVCSVCTRHFDHENNLKQHVVTHRRRSISCYGCVRMFRSYSAMIIHLESGTCDSGIGRLVLNRTAARCFQWRQFLREDFRHKLLAGVDIYEESTEEVYPFECPLCAAEFSNLAGLFQHVDSTACRQTLSMGSIGRLVKWLAKRHEGCRI